MKLNEEGAVEATPEAPTESGFLKGDLSRRAIVAAGIGAVGVVAAACSSTSSTPAATTSAPAPTTPTASPNSSPTGLVVTSVSDIPVGGAKLAEAGGTTWLLAQPTQGQIVCHSGICTHEGCPLTQVEGAVGVCACHGSRFNADTGAVEQGPATEPLAAQTVTVSGTKVLLG